MKVSSRGPSGLLICILAGVAATVLGIVGGIGIALLPATTLLRFVQPQPESQIDLLQRWGMVAVALNIVAWTVILLVMTKIANRLGR